MRFPCFTAALLAALLAGCGTRPPPVAAGAPVSPPPPHATLASEQGRLAELFRGTPVVFVMQPDGSLRVAVPLHYCFDRGSAVVKPPLAAVLDRVAKSQRLEATRLRVAAPPDRGTSAPTLVRDRAASTRDHLVAQGIAASRLTLAGAAAQVEGVEIVVAEPAPR